jgi:uncharacterized heparinase superfamily protein
MERAAMLAREEWTVFGEPVKFDAGVWSNPALSQLARYQLHYFDFADDLLVSRDVATFRRLAHLWIDANAELIGDGWHPYTVSLRVIQWLRAVSVMPELHDDAVLIRSLYGQCEFLRRNLEFDVRGNHLLENLRALILAGLAFEGAGATRWFRIGMRHLRAELREQIGPDGAHFERTPGYHLSLCREFLELLLVLEHTNVVDTEWLRDAVERMGDFLVVIVRPDGSVPLFKDTTEGALAPLDVLDALAVRFARPEFKRRDTPGAYARQLFGLHATTAFERLPTRSDSERAEIRGGYLVVSRADHGDHLIIDGGRVCPPYLPAHAHADMFSYELMIGGVPIVVDSGVYQYSEGVWRDYFRSTRAHNTVEVAGRNQSEVWGSFRVGRRATPSVRVSVDEGTVSFHGTHDGYRSLSPSVTHHRVLRFCRHRIFVVVDFLTGGAAEAISFVHLHPALSARGGENGIWKIAGSDAWIVASGFERLTIERGKEPPHPQGWYSQRFSDRVANDVIGLHFRGNKVVYVITEGGPAEIDRDMVRFRGRDYPLPELQQ